MEEKGNSGPKFVDMTSPEDNQRNFGVSIEEYMEEEDFNILKKDVYKCTADEILRIINKKRKEYYQKYNTEPKYIKMPISIKHLLENELNGYFEVNNIQRDKSIQCIYNLIVCDTLSITQIDEIEVF